MMMMMLLLVLQLNGGLMPTVDIVVIAAYIAVRTVRTGCRGLTC